MLPSLAVNDIANRASANTVFSGELIHGDVACGVSLTYSNDLLRRELGIVLRFAMCGPFATFGNHIVNVVLVRTEEQMIGIHAGRIVATMKHPQTIRDRAIGEFVTDMGSGHAGVPTPPRSNCAIAIFVTMAYPLPALIWAALVYFYPEPIREGAKGVLLAAHVMACNILSLSAWEFRRRQRYAATTRAQRDVGVYDFELLWSMILHGIRTSIAVTKVVAGSFTRRFCYFLLGDYSFIISQKEGAI